jgi:hypothetical protein
VPARGPNSDPKHGQTSFKRALPCYRAGRPKARLVIELENNLFFPIFVGHISPFFVT